MTGPQPGTVTIDIWSDVMCPWCVIGYKNLETALAALSGEIAAEIRWRPFELNPDMPREGEDAAEHVQRKYGRTPGQAAEGRARIAEIAERAGYSFAYTAAGEAPAQRMWNTFLAHKLLAHALAAHGPAVQTRLSLALFDAHFRERRNVSDVAVLVEIAQAAGLTREEAQAALDDRALADEVSAQRERAWNMNITAVPAMVVNGKYLVPGAQDPDAYVRVLRRAVEREALAG